MGISGNISTMSLAEVFQWLQTGQKTGNLHIEGSNGVTKDIYFQSGSISSASSSDPRELIAQFMLHTRNLTEQQLVDALESQKRDHFLLGKILVQKKILSKDDLIRLLQTISEEIIYDLFLWREGKFEFREGSLPKREIPPLNLDITHIVLEGATREDDWKRIHAVFPNDQTVIRPNVDKLVSLLPLETGLARLLSLINGNRGLDEIRQISKIGKFDLLKKMLDLHEKGLIEVGGYMDRMVQVRTEAKVDILGDKLALLDSLLKQGRLEEAERTISSLMAQAPQNTEVKKMAAAIKDKRLETTAKEMIHPDGVPTLKMDMTELTKMELSPEQGFIVSRINGVWDVKSIVKVSPFPESVCLKILKKFMDDGVITLK